MVWGCFLALDVVVVLACSVELFCVWDWFLRCFSASGCCRVGFSVIFGFVWLVWCSFLGWVGFSGASALVSVMRLGLWVGGFGQ